MATDSQVNWPRDAHTAGNAGVMLIGRSAKYEDVPAVVLGGRFYTGKKAYMYTDFGGGRDWQTARHPCRLPSVSLQKNSWV